MLLVSPRSRQIYSAMLPGLVAGHYVREEVEFDVAALCRRAVIIAEGQIKYDGSLSGIVDRFSGHKVVTLQFAEDETRHNKRTTEKASRAKIGDPSIDDDVGVDDERLMLGGLAGKTDIRNDEGKFITVAPHCEHGAEVAKRAVDHQSHDPLRLVGLVTQNLRSEEQVGEKKAEEQSEGRGGKGAQGETFEEPIDENENQPENQTDNQAGDGVVLRLSGDKRTNRSAKGEEEHPQKINGQLRSHFGLTT